MHIRMPGGDGCDPNALPQPYPGSTTSRLWSSGLNYGPHFRGRADQAQDGTLWEREVVPQIERIVAWVFCSRGGGLCGCANRPRGRRREAADASCSYPLTSSSTPTAR